MEDLLLRHLVCEQIFSIRILLLQYSVQSLFVTDKISLTRRGVLLCFTLTGTRIPFPKIVFLYALEKLLVRAFCTDSGFKSVEVKD